MNLFIIKNIATQVSIPYRYGNDQERADLLGVIEAIKEFKESVSIPYRYGNDEICRPL